MVQHMVLSMVAPIFLALGAPVTLALRTLPARPRRRAAARCCTAGSPGCCTFPLVAFGALRGQPVRALLHRPVPADAGARAGCTSWCTRTSSSTGCLFFWPLIGLDPLPGRWPYPARALLMVLSVPFHTVLGLTIMQSTHAARRRLVPVARPDLGRPVRRPGGWPAASCGPAASSSASPCSACWWCSGCGSPSGRRGGSTGSWTGPRPRQPRAAPQTGGGTPASRATPIAAVAVRSASTYERGTADER